jgi:hypothetical protein
VEDEHFLGNFGVLLGVEVDGFEGEFDHFAELVLVVGVDGGLGEEGGESLVDSGTARNAVLLGHDGGAGNFSDWFSYLIASEGLSFKCAFRILFSLCKSSFLNFSKPCLRTAAVIMRQMLMLSLNQFIFAPRLVFSFKFRSIDAHGLHRGTLSVDTLCGQYISS